MAEETIRFQVPGLSEARLDLVVVDYLIGHSAFSWMTRSQVKMCIERGGISVEGNVVTKAGAMVKPGQEIRCKIEIPESTLRPYDFPLSILFEDEDLLVIDKPAGISIHPGAGERWRTIANAIEHHREKGAKSDLYGERPGIVHRLDKDTSGVVVIAKNIRSQGVLSRQFAARTVEKEYRTLVFSTPRGGREVSRSDEGIVEGAIGRHKKDRRKMAICEEGKAARTRWHVLERMSYGTLLSVKIETGRTHQIRVHMESIGSPVIGDRVYGDFSGLPKSLQVMAHSFGRQALHAYKLGFQHPVSSKQMSFIAPLPEDMEELIEGFRVWKG